MPKNSSPKGGANPKMTKYPRILDYLQAHHKDVYQIIEDLAMHGSLSPRRGGGITFLMPDAALIKKINKLIESDEPEVATDEVGSLVITEYLPNIKAFTANKNNIPTLAGKKLVVKSLENDKVVLGNGSIITIEEGKKTFRPFLRSGLAQRGNMAVWSLKGEIDWKSAPETEMRHHEKEGGVLKKSARKGKRGGAENQAELDAFVQRVVQEEFRNIRNAPDGEKRKSPMLRAVVQQMQKWQSEGSSNYDKARAILSLHPIISFFLLYKNRLYFPHTELSVFNNLNGPDNAFDLLRSMIDESQNAEQNKQAICDYKETKGVSIKTPANIRAAYSALDRDNAIGAAKNVYPAAAVAAFQANPGLHLLIDEFRHSLYCGIMEMNKVRSRDEEAQCFNEIIGTVNCFRSLTQPSASVMDKLDELNKAQAVQQIHEPFWNGFALYVPCTKFDDRSEYAYTGAGDDEGGDDDDVKRGNKNPEKDLADVAKRGIADEGEPIEDEDAAELDDKVLAYIKKHGDLPGRAGKEYECKKRSDDE